MLFSATPTSKRRGTIADPDWVRSAESETESDDYPSDIVTDDYTSGSVSDDYVSDSVTDETLTPHDTSDSEVDSTVQDGAMMPPPATGYRRLICSPRASSLSPTPPDLGPMPFVAVPFPNPAVSPVLPPWTPAPGSTT